MKTVSTHIARIVVMPFTALVALACDPNVPNEESAADDGGESPLVGPGSAELHWSYDRASEAFGGAVIPTLQEVEGTWKTAAWAHSKSGNLALSPTGIHADGEIGFKELFSFALAEGEPSTTLALTLTTSVSGADGTVQEKALALGASFLAEDAIPEDLPLGHRQTGECRYLSATDTTPEHLLCKVRGIGSGSVIYSCMVRLSVYNESACKF